MARAGRSRPGGLPLFPEERRHPSPSAPLAERMRPKSFEEFVGQEHLLGPGKILRTVIETGDLPSLILWGPPGTGKTTLAFLLAERIAATFLPFSAVTTGIKEMKETIAEAEYHLTALQKRTILFVDEIHRFNKAQQDAFLPHVERGTILLIGATTENPSFEVIAPLLSRVRVLPLHPLADEEILILLQRALGDAERGLGAQPIAADPEALQAIARLACGDARAALNILEVAVTMAPLLEEKKHLTSPLIHEAAQRRTLLYDKAGEEHYNLISALHKSVRGSDPDAALYWLARMLTSGEDPLYIARRLVRMAVEDIGNADPVALHMALAAKEAYHFLGSPEGELALAQCTLYLATAPKSNAVYLAWGAVQEDVQSAPVAPVPLHLRNAPTPLMDDLGYGEGYRYPHDYPEAVVAQEYLPKELQGRTYYRPTDRGLEAEIAKRLDRWRTLRHEKGAQETS